ncbi:GNAT family N-acetyltransferase [Candidatus Phytoplasma prunorum]|uniref:GNAT family N-acetyltransferase n=1 Tax=Candidatus Phytoplasma prunorum TaxID=47565 RepID=UPI002FEFA7AF
MEIYLKIKSILKSDKKNLSKINNFLKKQGFKKDIIDDFGVIFSENQEIIGTVGRYRNNLKCLAIKKEYQKQNISNQLITYMIEKIYQKGFNEVFVFTKNDYFFIFQNLGFELLYGNDNFGFFTNRNDLFLKYINYLRSKTKISHNSGVIVLNANPFTKGHEYLIKKSLQISDIIYLIVVKEEGSFFDYQKRLEMVKLGVKKIKNVIVLEGSNYLISKNVFPSYFLPSTKEVIEQQTILDTYIFVNYIAKVLKVKKRFVGEEPYSMTTNQYNNTMKNILKNNNLELIIFPRLKFENKYISATQVRKLFVLGQFNKLSSLIPKTTLNYLKKLDYLEYQNNIYLIKLVDKQY